MAANFEFKAKMVRPEALREIKNILFSKGAALVYERDQDDTVFLMPGKLSGLKLRVQSPGVSQLISWQRPQQHAPKVCEYFVAVVNDPDATRQVLSSALGVYGRVIKHRDGFSYKDVIVRLDTVKDVGEFVECEASLEKMPETRAREILDELMQVLSISPSMMVERSYVNLVHDVTARRYFVVFADDSAGGYGYWLDDSESVWERTKGERDLHSVDCGSFPSEKEELAKRILEEACSLREESSLRCKLEELSRL